MLKFQPRLDPILHLNQDINKSAFIYSELAHLRVKVHVSVKVR